MSLVFKFVKFLNNYVIIEIRVAITLIVVIVFPKLKQLYCTTSCPANHRGGISHL